ncbi:MAG: hypothetical protein ACI8S6_002208, partial [Myxococcota bacterium]
MSLSDDQKRTVRPYHQASSGSLRKVVGSGGQRQGNFFLVIGDTTAGLVITQSHKDPTAQQAKSKGRKLRALYRKVEVAKFAQGTVGLDEKKRLVFTMLAGNARPALIKLRFKDTSLWRDLGFDKPDLLKRARVEMRKEDAEGQLVEEEAETDSDETALSSDEIEAAAAFRFGDLPDLRTLLMSARDIASANEAVVAALSELDAEDEAEQTFDEIELMMLERGSDTEGLTAALAVAYPDLSFSDEQLDLLAEITETVCADLPETLDLKTLQHWLAEFEIASGDLLLQAEAWTKAVEADPESSEGVAALLSLHFVQRRQARAIQQGLRTFEALPPEIRDEQISAGGLQQSGAQWRVQLVEADADAFARDADRLWDPKQIADAEQEILDFPEEAPMTLDDWEEPTSEQGRTRCPFLNLSANHGWIPRSGWVSYSQMRRALVERGALTATVAELLTSDVFKKCGVTGPDGTEMLNLADLRHAGIFHPGGLAHEDDRIGADEDIVEMFAEISEDGEYLTEEDVRVAMKARHEESGALTLSNMPFAFGEA